MNVIKCILVWLRRLPYCCGFGIQSPTDYAFVREVVNEHGMYYAYGEFRTDEELREDALHRKLGKLYFRLANWRQPSLMVQDTYERYWKAGCKRIQWAASLTRLELGRMSLEGDYRGKFQRICGIVDCCSVLVIEGIYHDWDFWHEVEKDVHTGVTFDFYYCGIFFFDKKRHKKNYKVNF